MSGILRRDEKGLAFVSGDLKLRGDFTRLLHRIRANNLSRELLVRAAKIKGEKREWTAVDATAGLGEDSLILAAFGFRVTLYEKNPVIWELLNDALLRAEKIPQLKDAVSRMSLFCEDSVIAMKKIKEAPDVILLDPMFPQRQKNTLAKKKLQVIQRLETPCADEDERELFLAAAQANPKKLVIKRPPKGPYLAGISPDYSISGKAVRFDCIVFPKEKIKR